MREQRSLNELKVSNINSFAKNHPKRVVKDMENIGLTKDQINVLKKSLNARGVNNMFFNRKMMIKYDMELKQTVKMVLDNIVSIKKEMYPNYVYPSEVERNEKTIHDYVKYVNLRNRHIELKAFLTSLEGFRKDLRMFGALNGYFTWDNKNITMKRKVTIEQLLTI